MKKTREQKLAESRKAAYAAAAEHEHDIKTDPEYAALAAKQMTLVQVDPPVVLGYRGGDIYKGDTHNFDDYGAAYRWYISASYAKASNAEAVISVDEAKAFYYIKAVGPDGEGEIIDGGGVVDDAWEGR